MPHVNSSQHLCHSYVSPNSVCWSHDNRAAGLCIPASRPPARHVEDRLSSADANPYPAIAANLAAGLYGLEHELGPDPVIQDEFEASEGLTLPCTIYDALRRLRGSALACEPFGGESVEGHTTTKSTELTSFLNEINPWERRVLATQA